jgi:hypothetical protein
MMHRLCKGTAFLISLVVMISAWAQSAQPLKYGMTDMEIAMLPDYCRVRLVGDADAKAQWGQRMGNDKFIHLHHYCGGVGALSRARTALDLQKKKESLSLAIREFDYVLRNWPPDFYLYKEATILRAQAVAMGGVR